MVYGIICVGERINCVLLIFKGVNYIRGGFLRESDLLLYCFKKLYVILGGGGYILLFFFRFIFVYDLFKILFVFVLIWFVIFIKCLFM